MSKEETNIHDNEEKKEEFKSHIYNILTSDDPSLDEMCWIKTVHRNVSDLKLTPFDDEKNYPALDKPITTRMAALSRLTGRPYRIKKHYTFGPMGDYDIYYENQIIDSENMTSEQKEQAELVKSEIEARKQQKAENVKGKVHLLGYDGKYNKDNLNITAEHFEKDGFFSIELDISNSELLQRGIDPDEIGWKSLEQIREEQIQEEQKENLKVSPKEIAELDKETALTTTEIGFFGRFINKIKEKFKFRNNR